MNEQNNIKPKRDRIGIVLYLVYLALLAFSVVLVVKLVRIQVAFNPEPRIEKALTPASARKELESARGNIYDCNGKMLATTVQRYNIYMDCTVRKKEFARNSQTRDSLEKVWMGKAYALSERLAAEFPEHDAKWYYSEIRRGRANGEKFKRFGGLVDKQTFDRVRSFPLFREGSNKGGLITRKEDIVKKVRRYPYGSVGRRTIGFIRDENTGVGNRFVGIEGKMDSVLRGRSGVEWMRRSDEGYVQDFDSSYVAAVDGHDVRITLNIDYQEIADRALREQIKDDPDIEGGCLILMDVHTGAIRAMVNLLRDKHGRLEESYNLAIGRLGEPGSVFKISTLMTAMEDGYVHSLDDRIPANGGVIEGYKYAKDDHITDYVREHHTSMIPLTYCVQVSSNYAFRYLAINYYKDNPARFYDRIRRYKLADALDFDIEGCSRPSFIDPSNKKIWNKHDLGSVAMGYAISETPLHILNFYNAIAADGRMMKPYVIQSIEHDGKVIEQRYPTVLDTAICSAATAAEIRRGLEMVTSEGTAKVLADAACKVGGKTGTSRVALESGKYEESGKHKNQGTFVGYFPAEDPQYSIIAVVYSTLSTKSFYGGSIPARAVKTVVNDIYNIDPYWRTSL